METSWLNRAENAKKTLRIGANGEPRTITVSNSHFECKVYDNQLIALLMIHSDDPKNENSLYDDMICSSVLYYDLVVILQVE